jgi:hypothetical protein
MTGEYRGKIIIEADPQAVERTQKSVNNLAQGFVGLSSVTRGVGMLLSGNATGLIELGAGARVAWLALRNLVPWVRVASIAFAVLTPVVGFLIRQFRNSKDVETFGDKLRRLGLIERDINRLQRSLKANADALKANADNANAAANAYERFLQAQQAVANIERGVQQQRTDIEEQEALNKPGLTEDERRRIRADFEKRRVDEETEYRSKEIDRERNRIGNDLWQNTEDRKLVLAEKGEDENAMRQTLIQVLADARKVSQAGGTVNRETKAQIIERAEAGDLEGALKLATVQRMFTDLPTKAAEEAAKQMKGSADAGQELLGEAQGRRATRQARLDALGEKDRAMQLEVVALFNEQKELSGLANSRKSVIDQQLANDRDEDESRATATENEYRFGKADPATQLGVLERVLKGLVGRDLTPEQRERRVELMERRDKLLAEKAKTDNDQAKDQKKRDDLVASAGSGLKSQAMGLTRSIDTSQIFEAYYAGGAGKTGFGKDILAERAKEQVELLRVIATAMQGEET